MKTEYELTEHEMRRWDAKADILRVLVPDYTDDKQELFMRLADDLENLSDGTLKLLAQHLEAGRSKCP